MTVVDASVVVAALLDGGPDGRWAADVLGGSVVAPHLMPAEVTQTIRRLVRSGVISADVAALALEDVTDLVVELFEFAPFVDRVWELRDVATAYDSWYVALAESLDDPLATLDRRLAQAPGLGCEVLLPPMP